VNDTPIYSSTRDLDAEDWNKIVAGLSEVALRNRFGMLVCSSWSAPNVAASASAVALYRGSGGDTANSVQLMPWAGTIVGLAVRVENARTAGTLTINVEVWGTPIQLEVVIDGSEPQEATVTQLPAAAVTAGDTFAAGDKIEVTYTTDGSWAAGATPSVDVDLYLAVGD